MADGGGDCVKVAIRTRPPSEKEIANGEGKIVEMTESYTDDGDQGQVILNDPSGHDEPSKFAFDIVFGLAVEQATIYTAVGQPALAKTFEGYNGTIFAYGQTGSGKSWSMSGGNGDLRGITPRVNEELFQRVAEESVGTKRFLVMCSYFEIYNEIIFDLLNPPADRSKFGGGLQVKEHPVLGIYVKDLTEIVAEGSQKLEDLLETGIKNRAVSSTMMNSTSSRSHSIFTIKVHQKDEEDKSKNVFAKLNLVDLAGSERQKGTGATGQTLKEGANINKSLSALGNVINALVEVANGKKIFIPYRNSKLTRVLQESLGGNSLCTMLATLSPAACNYEETMSTLRYANRAKAIQVSATKNEEASQISRLKAQVDELKKKLESSASGGGRVVGLSEAEREAEKLNYESQVKQMEEMLNSNWGDKAKISEEHERKMQKVAEDQRRAAEAVAEERSRRLKLLQEKNDLELSVRGIIDFVQNLPKLKLPPPVLTGEAPRQWLKHYRSLRLLVAELKEQRTMVLVFKHAFDEDVRLWGEGADADDEGIARTGLNRCLPKLDKLKRGAEKLLQLESRGLKTANEIAESVNQAVHDLEKFQVLTDGETEDKREVSSESLDNEQQNCASVLEVSRLLLVVSQQVQQKIEEIEQIASLEMVQTCEIVLQSTKSSLGEGSDVSLENLCAALRSFISEPGLSVLPPSMPQKPIKDLLPEDVSDTPETTEAVLSQVIRWDEFSGGKMKKPAVELLSRPPPKFLLDVAVTVKVATGFPPSMQTDWPEAREERLERFQSIADAVGTSLRTVIDFDPADVLKGKEVAKTLRLLQLLAIAAARASTQSKMPQSSQSAVPSKLRKGSIRPYQLQTMIDKMLRCIEGAKQHMESLRDAGVAAVCGESSLEQQIEEIQRKLEEEVRARFNQEKALAVLEQSVQESQAELKRVSNECDVNAGLVKDDEHVELKRQFETLLLEAASPGDIDEETMLKLLRGELLVVQRGLEKEEAETALLVEKQQELERAIGESNVGAKLLEIEVDKERKRRELEDELMCQSPEEQLLILKAHEKKSRTRAETLDAQIAQMQTEAEERKASILRLEAESHDVKAKIEDAHLQMQIVQEERDAMREAMEILWNEKTCIDDELHDCMQGYINLTERFQQQQDHACEMEMLVEQKRRGVAMLQKNGFM